jgi:hypothetical protein
MADAEDVDEVDEEEGDVEDDEVEADDDETENGDDELKLALFSLAFDENTFELQLDRLLELL